MKTLYFDIISGISGDMTLSTLIQLGANTDDLNQQLSQLLAGTVTLSLIDDKINGIAVKQLNIHTENCQTPHRNFTAISKMVMNSTLPEQVKTDAIAIFEKIAIAEATVHNQPMEKVHFHEVGAIDSIIDIVGAVYAIHQLNPDRVLSSPVVIGNGMVKTEHGLLPVPAPATTVILKGTPIKRIDIDSELTTPTGAAIISHYAESFTKELEGQITHNSYACGSKRFDHHPNMLRAFMITEDTSVPQHTDIIETHLDDETGENLGYVINLLMENGALDASYTPILMKKNRPANKLTVICRPSDKEQLIEMILKYTTAAGVRYYPTNRVVMNRSSESITVEGQSIRLKKLTYGSISKSAPEWDDVVSAAQKLNTTPAALYQQIQG